MRKAFTLAEVLITLGIIGVVAALTIPVLHNTYEKAVTTTKLKRVYSLLMNATLMSIQENGDSKYWTYPMSEENEIANKDKLDTFFYKYYAPYLKLGVLNSTAQEYKYIAHNFNGIDAQLDHGSSVMGRLSVGADEMCIRMWANTQFFVFTADVNCEAPPNIVGRDIFDIAELYWEGNRQMVIPGMRLIEQAASRQSYIDRCKSFTYVSGGASPCFAIFVHDGWQFKDDYPWKR